jgi:hypothetical protein
VLAGITLSHKQVQRGMQLAAERGLNNVKFMVSRAAVNPWYVKPKQYWFPCWQLVPCWCACSSLELSSVWGPTCSDGVVWVCRRATLLSMLLST